MFRTKVRFHTCKVILATSLVWFLIDVVVLTFYSDCVGRGGWGCPEDGSVPTPQAQVATSSKETATSSKGRGNLHELMRDRGKKTYSPWELVKWKPAPSIREQVSHRCSFSYKQQIERLYLFLKIELKLDKLKFGIALYTLKIMG